MTNGKKLGGTEFTNTTSLIKNSVVLDPFNGSGSTGIAALKLGHEYIGMDLSQKYITISERRINDTVSNDADAFNKLFKF